MVGAVYPSKSATIHSRRRLCGTPHHSASWTVQLMEYPSPTTVPLLLHFPAGRGITASGSATLAVSSRTARKSSPPLLESAPTTFSHTRCRGTHRKLLAVAFRISLTIRIISINRPLRSPARPALPPATLKSWQGLPPVMTSTGGISAPFILVMSPK